MKKITTRGNLPKTLQVLAKEYQSTANTKFWECSTTSEIENAAKEKKCELTCVLDPTTQRGFLVGMEASEPPITLLTNTVLNLDVYFIELKDADFIRYDKMLKKHRKMQEQNMLQQKQRRKND